MLLGLMSMVQLMLWLSCVDRGGAVLLPSDVSNYNDGYDDHGGYSSCDYELPRLLQLRCENQEARG